MKPLQKILIANRSEIALRILLTCRSLGIATVALYTKQDATSPHVWMADEAHLLAQEGYAGYTDQDAILHIAALSRVDAIHPGYGFLAENPTFAQRVVDAGLTFIGPRPEQIALMADKHRARNTMEHHGVPVVPGIWLNADNVTAQEAAIQAERIGFPIIIKSVLGGGGKAMRQVQRASDFETAWQLTISESEKLFATRELIIEKYLTHGRHIEVQVAGDGHTVVHLFERECSIQRNQQKIIEETPCLFVSRTTLHKLYDMACTAAAAINYTNIGTVEFLVTPHEEIYFLEMNTRLQVEHSVTELTTGIDLVALQIQLAGGSPLPFRQTHIKRRGHALECRIYAEDPAQKFAPSTGIISTLSFAQGPFVRYDHALEEGCAISPFFDPMIAKITTFGHTREGAVAHMLTYLRSAHIGGITTNISFLQRILDCSNFAKGRFHTQWLKNALPDLIDDISLIPTKELPAIELAVVSAALIPEQPIQLTSQTQAETQPSTSPSLWRRQQWQ